MNKLEKYSAYKDSGVEWLGEIPEGWMTLANKHIFKIKQNLVGKKSKEYDLLSLTLKGIIKRDMDNPKGKFPTDFDTYQEVKIDDFVFCLFDVEETPRTVGLSDYDGMITGAYTVMQANSLNKDYLYYFYLNLDSKKRLKFLYKGLRNTIPKDAFFSFKTLIPPKQEQIKMASFLDTKTEQLDKAIKQKEQLLELLKERRQILINNAVTKGIDNTVAMKDSRVEWIGEIPKHWEVKKMKYVVKKIADIGHYMPDTVSVGKPYLMTGDILDRASLINFSNCKQIAEKDFLKLSKKIRPMIDDLIFARYATIGTVCYVDIEKDFLVSYSCVTIKPNPKSIMGKYLFYYLKSDAFSKEIKKYINSNTQGNVGIDSLYKARLVIPQILEQNNIVNYIEKNNHKIYKAIKLQQEQIIKLKEYKTTLMDSVVTGKVRVV